MSFEQIQDDYTKIHQKFEQQASELESRLVFDLATRLSTLEKWVQTYLQYNASDLIQLMTTELETYRAKLDAMGSDLSRIIEETDDSTQTLNDLDWLNEEFDDKDYQAGAVITPLVHRRQLKSSQITAIAEPDTMYTLTVLPWYNETTLSWKSITPAALLDGEVASVLTASLSTTEENSLYIAAPQGITHFALVFRLDVRMSFPATTKDNEYNTIPMKETTLETIYAIDQLKSSITSDANRPNEYKQSIKITAAHKNGEFYEHSQVSTLNVGKSSILLKVKLRPTDNEIHFNASLNITAFYYTDIN